MKTSLKLLYDKLLEAFVSVVPIVAIVLLIFGLQFTSAFPNNNVISTNTLLIFIASMITLALGMGLFTLGSEKSMTKVGMHIGSSITKKQSIVLIVIVSFALGLMITIAEPDLTVLGDFVSANGIINSWIFKLCIGIGVGIFLVIGLLRIIFQKSLKLWLIFFYALIFGLACLLGSNGSAICEISFDSSGVTTGPVTVPFLLTFGAGVASVRGGKNSSGDSFGVTGLCSIGPIIMSLLIFLPMQNSEIFATFKNELNTSPVFINVLSNVLLEVLIAILPIVCFFYIYNFIFIKLSVKELIKIGIGFLYTYFGLVIFLVSAKVGLIPLASELSKNILLGGESYYYLLIIIAILVGCFIVLAEPSVHILVEQVEEISGRSITKWSILISLSVGVSLAIVLAVVRIVYGNNFNIMYYYVPLFLLALALTFFVPDIYAAIAFDSGGVASGTMASCFVLPFIIGIGSNNDSVSGFGVIGLIAVVPIISIQVLGIVASLKEKYILFTARKRLIEENDEQIIVFKE